MASFIISHKKTAFNEGGYVNDKDDPGGETWRGIARKKNPHWSGWEIVDAYKAQPNFPASLSHDGRLVSMALDFYRKNYWNVIKGDELKFQDAADQLYDSAVNVGTKTAIKLAQRALNIPDTGEMDKLTLNKLNNT